MSDLTAMWLLGFGVGFGVGSAVTVGIASVADRFYGSEDDDE